MAHDVFICHSSKDFAISDAARAKLEDAGIHCWIAPRNVNPTKTWPGEIVAAIGQTQILLLIFSSNSNVSQNVLNEVGLASNRRKSIFPLRIEDVTMSQDLEYYLTTVHWMDATMPPMETRLLELVHTMLGLLGGPTISELAPVEVPQENVEHFEYDVLISCAETEFPWVFENVFCPFRDARLPNGRRLFIFFDRETPRSSEAWKPKLASAIDLSRFVLPVYSEAYFGNPKCRFEISQAFRKWASADYRGVLPIARGRPTIPRSVQDMQAISVDDDPSVVHRLLSAIVDACARQQL